MVKRQKLSQQQKRRIAHNQQQLQQTHLPKKSNVQCEHHQGVVISRFGEQADVATSDKTIIRCHLRQNLGSIVSGDEVIFHLDTPQQGIIEAVEPRTSEFQRPTPHGGLKTVVANIDQIFILVAPQPEFSSMLLDRYLVASTLANIKTFIVFNKIDVLSKQALCQLQKDLSYYQDLGYPLFFISCHQEDTLQKLKQQCQQHKSIFVGQSGVGKSTLLNTMIPQANALTGEISDTSQLGMHTTTTSTLYFMPESGHIIDSPGIRAFSLTHITFEQLTQGFIDIATLSHQCKFRNCRHRQEPGCAVIAAKDSGQLHPQRFQNFQTIAKEIQD